MKRRRNGKEEEWKGGGMERRRNGKEEEWKGIPLHPPNTKMRNLVAFCANSITAASVIWH
jgi:hypothetical protein